LANAVSEAGRHARHTWRGFDLFVGGFNNNHNNHNNHNHNN
jgi:hypothetical protein